MHHYLIIQMSCAYLQRVTIGSTLCDTFSIIKLRVAEVKLEHPVGGPLPIQNNLCLWNQPPNTQQDN